MREFLIDQKPVVAGKSWGITDKINARTTLSMKVVDKLNVDTIDNGDEIIMKNDNELVFAGVISSVKLKEIARGVIEYNVKAVDYSALCDRRRIVKVFENAYAGDIVREMIRLKLHEEGIVPGLIEKGPLVKRAVFNYWTCSKALDHLKTIAGFNWTVDDQKRLNFMSRSSNRSDIVVDDNFRMRNYSHESTAKEYRNTQYTRGGKSKTSLQDKETPSPSPDGESRNFLLRYPLADKPVIEVNVEGNGFVQVDPNDVGVNGKDKGKKWYYENDSAVIIHDEELALDKAKGDQIRVNYYGLRNLFVMLEDSDEIEQRRLKEKGSSGIYEHMAVEKSLDDSATAIQYTQGLLDTYGEIKDVSTFKTHEHGLKAGQLVRIDKPAFGVHDDFLIESVAIRPEGPNMIEYSIKCLDGAAVGGWEKLFKRLHDNQEDFVIAENEVIITIQNQGEKMKYQGKYSVVKLQGVLPSNTLVPSNDLTPGIREREMMIVD